MEVIRLLQTFSFPFSGLFVPNPAQLLIFNYQAIVFSQNLPTSKKTTMNWQPLQNYFDPFGL
jgi:hypothetical protein